MPNWQFFKNCTFRYSAPFQIDKIPTQTFQYNISRAWLSFQNAYMSFFNRLTNLHYPDRNKPSNTIAILPETLPETRHLAFQSFIKLTTSWPRPSRIIFSGIGSPSSNIASRD